MTGYIAAHHLRKDIQILIENNSVNALLKNSHLTMDH